MIEVFHLLYINPSVITLTINLTIDINIKNVVAIGSPSLYESSAIINNKSGTSNILTYLIILIFSCYLITSYFFFLDGPLNQLYIDQM